MTMCNASCMCGGQLEAEFCPMLPGCKACAHVRLLIIRFTPIHLDFDETIDERISRDDMLSQLPERYQQPGRMN